MIFKLLRPTEWAELQSRGSFAGSQADLKDGFIHFSTAEQVRETARRHFAAEPEVVLAEVEPETLGSSLRWEPSRGGALFPHLYAALPLEAVRRTWRLEAGPEGHAFPPVFG